MGDERHVAGRKWPTSPTTRTHTGPESPAQHMPHTDGIMSRFAHEVMDASMQRSRKALLCKPLQTFLKFVLI